MRLENAAVLSPRPFFIKPKVSRKVVDSDVVDGNK